MCSRRTILHYVPVNTAWQMQSRPTCLSCWNVWIHVIKFNIWAGLKSAWKILIFASWVILYSNSCTLFLAYKTAPVKGLLAFGPVLSKTKSGRRALCWLLSPPSLGDGGWVVQVCVGKVKRHNMKNVYKRTFILANTESILSPFAPALHWMNLMPCKIPW